MTHICVSKLTVIGSDNGLSPHRRQAIIWTNAGLLSIRTSGTNFSEILIEILAFSLKKMRLKVSSGKWRPFCFGLNELTSLHVHVQLLVTAFGKTACYFEHLSVIPYITHKYNLNVLVVWTLNRLPMSRTLTGFAAYAMPRQARWALKSAVWRLPLGEVWVEWVNLGVFSSRRTCANWYTVWCSRFPIISLTLFFKMFTCAIELCALELICDWVAVIRYAYYVWNHQQNIFCGLHSVWSHI